MVAKAGLGLIGLSAISIGGVAVAKPHLLGMDYMPEFHTLSKDSDYNSTYSDSDHFGKKYGKYLAGVTNESQKTDKNQKFWEWAFRRLSRETITQGKFTNTGAESAIKVSKPHDTNGGVNSKALNQVCKEAYGKKDNEFQTTSDTSDSKFNKGDVWKYCSPIGQEPTTVQKYDRKSSDSANKKYENGTEGGGEKIGKKQETSLISVFDKGNDVFWDMRNKEIKEKTLTVDSGHNFFKKAEDKNTHIKDVCKEAYDKPSTATEGTTPSPSDTETKKYCSLDTSAAT